LPRLASSAALSLVSSYIAWSRSPCNLFTSSYNRSKLYKITRACVLKKAEIDTVRLDSQRKELHRNVHSSHGVSNSNVQSQPGLRLPSELLWLMSSLTEHRYQFCAWFLTPADLVTYATKKATPPAVKLDSIQKGNPTPYKRRTPKTAK
jgi:hypothetical protein